jgi:antitoxin MazE6
MARTDIDSALARRQRAIVCRAAAVTHSSGTHRLGVAETRLGGQQQEKRVVDRKQAGYTFSMKIAVSVPDDVFLEGERLARRMKRSRSEVYSRALAEYVARHAPDRVTEAMDRALAEISEPVDEVVRAASRRVLRRSDW